MITDVCLCEYTSHGHCGFVRDGSVDNDITLELLAKTAISHAEAGADVVAPSRHDGRADRGDPRTSSTRRATPRPRSSPTRAKYASAFYGPFREAAESTPEFGDRRGYQMDPANAARRVREAQLDVEEGADMVMVKPALPVPRRDPPRQGRDARAGRRLQGVGRVLDAEGGGRRTAGSTSAPRCWRR